MGSKNTNGYTIRGGKFYVQGSIDGEFKRYSSGLAVTKKNETFIKKNHRSELLRIHEEKINKNKPFKDMSPNICIYAETVFERYENDLDEDTTKEYRGMFDLWIKPTFEHFGIADITKTDCVNWQKKLAKTNSTKGTILSPRRVNNVRSVFYKILQEAVEIDELIKENPFAKIKRESEIKYTNVEVDDDENEDIDPFTLQEATAIVTTTEGCWQIDFIQVGFFTGMRTGEEIALRWDDINFLSNEIRIRRTIRKGKVKKPKTKNSVRTIDMLPPVREALLRMKKRTYLKNSYVFLNENGNHFYDGSIVRNGVWKSTLKLCGLDYRKLYQTRHTFATMMISRGEDITWVSQMLGHASVEITLKIYTKYIKTEKRKRAAFLDNFATAEQNEQKTAQVVQVVSKTAQTTAQNDFKIKKVS